MRIKRYHLVLAPDAEKLQSEVNKLISEGWQPVGPVTVAPPAPGSEARFIQVMVQHEGEIRG